MRTPNSECCICGKPLYRRPSQLGRVRHVACMVHRGLAQAQSGVTEAQKSALALGRLPGTNHRDGYSHREESKRKASESHRVWCAANRDKVKARAAKNSGANHYRWNGGASHLNTAVRRLNEHRKWVDAVVRRDGACQKCGIDTDLESHHIKPMAEIIRENKITSIKMARECVELWSLSNGTALCEKCHCKHHGRSHTPTGLGRRKQPRKVRRSMAGTANPNYRGGKVTIECPQCGVHFEVKQAEVGKRKCCSRRCLGESQRKNV